MRMDGYIGCETKLKSSVTLRYSTELKSALENELISFWVTFNTIASLELKFVHG